MANEIILSTKNEVSTGVDHFTTALTSYLNELGLPTDKVLVAIPGAVKLFKSIALP